MRIDGISHQGYKPSHKAISIKQFENKKELYLYNKVLEATGKLKLPGVFKLYEIELPRVTQDLIDELNSMGIKYSTVKIA